MIPTNREEFKQFCLQELGHPVIQINLTDEQIDNRIDRALNYFIQFHFDATEKTYYKYQITPTDATNGYITLPENIMGVVRVFDLGTYFSGSDTLFNVRYQLALNEIYTLMSSSLAPYYVAMYHLADIQELLVGKTQIRYTRAKNRLHIDINANKLVPGYWVVVEAYQVIDPEEYPKIYNDVWLQRYATALIKELWGSVLTKFTMTLPGNVTYNGQQILSDAQSAITMLEQEMRSTWEVPPIFFVG